MAPVAAIVAVLLLGSALPAAAQQSPWSLAYRGRVLEAGLEPSLAIDTDDDDDNGVADGRQLAGIPEGDLLKVTARDEPGQVQVEGGLRLVQRGRALRVRSARLQQGESIHVQAVGVKSASPRLRLFGVTSHRAVRIRMVGLALLDGSNQPLDPSRQALGVSLHITNDRSLPRGRAPDLTSADARNIRVELYDADLHIDRVDAALESVDPVTGSVHQRIPLILTRPGPGRPHRSTFLRLVADQIDARAPGVSGQLLQVRLRDVVRLVRQTPSGPVDHAMRVGRPGDEDGPSAARQVRLRVVVLRAHPGGPPVIGHDELSASTIVRNQVRVANRIWLQCHLTLGAESEVPIVFADPPPATLLSVGDGDGLPALGGGRVVLSVDGKPIEPISTRGGDAPLDTAFALAKAFDKAGYFSKVTRNPPTAFGAGASADVLVLRRDNSPVTLAARAGTSPSSDPRQGVQIGHVDLGDGLQEFNNMTARSGSLEERTLIKFLSDEDPTTLDLFVVNRFADGSRQGEAFIERSAGPIQNTVVLDRNGLRQIHTAWTMAHEVGHVLLDEPLHPDNVGPDRPWLLMDSDSSRGTVLGPKRITANDCARIRHRSGVHSLPPLLQRYGGRSPKPPRRGKAEYYTGYPRPGS